MVIKCLTIFELLKNDEMLKLFYTVQKLTAPGVQELLEKMACFYRHAIFVSLTLH